jgi:predicted transcriptional regulator
MSHSRTQHFDANDRRMRYDNDMTKMLEDAIKKVRELPTIEQDEAAAMLLSVAWKNRELVEIDDETRAAIQVGREQARRGEFVSDKDMAAFFRRCGVKRYVA